MASGSRQHSSLAPQSEAPSHTCLHANGIVARIELASDGHEQNRRHRRIGIFRGVMSSHCCSKPTRMSSPTPSSLAPALAGSSRAENFFDLAAAPDDAFVRLGRPDIVIHLAWSGLPNYLSPRHLEVELRASRNSWIG